MKIIIEHGHTKRQIEGPFNICIGPEDLELLVEQLQEYLTERHGYGWLRVYDRWQKPILNTPPQDWDG